MRVGVDSGGTFTDAVALDDDGRLHYAKTPSTPDDPARAVLGLVEQLSRGAAVELTHSTTVATNALLERRGGPTVLVTTAGFEDVLELGRQARPHLYALHPVKTPVLLDEQLRLGIEERMAADGTPLLVPDPDQLEALRERVKALSPKSIAVCLLHAHRNDAHERLVGTALAPLGLPVSLSSEVLPLPREFERTMTTVVDAYVGTTLRPYLQRLHRRGPRLRLMHSGGGAVGYSETVRRPVRTLLSGPAAGLVGARRMAVAAGLHDLVTFDMGGTSTDVGLILDGEVARTDELTIAGCPLQLPSYSIHTVGAGGGSIATLDPGGALKVGPRSAGADPGPACYGRGGQAPTVTDAHLVLGRLPEALLDGQMELDRAAAAAALSSLALAFGGSIESAAEAILEVADAVMARAIKTLSVERGHDPSSLTLMAFGGAGGLHACSLASELGMRKVYVPPSPGLLCAYGALSAETIYDFVRSWPQLLGPMLSVDEFAPQFAVLEASARQTLVRDGVATEARYERRCALRYRGQGFDLLVPATGDLVAQFQAAHRTHYGYTLSEPVELVSLRLRAVVEEDRIPPMQVAPIAGEARLGTTSLVWKGQRLKASIFDRRRLAQGRRIAGPALLVELSATTLVPPDAEAEVTPEGGLLIQRVTG
jgi:N-methylhydantoinase A